MKKLFASLIAFMLLLSTTATQAELSDRSKTVIDKTITELMQKYQIPGTAVELYVDGKPYAFNYGYEQITKSTPISDSTIFEVGSITKLFTNLLLAMQIHSGKTQLETPLGNYLFTTQPANTPIKTVTLENLATYTAGLPFKAPEDVKTQEAFKNFLITWKPTAPIGSSWQYSNISTHLIGEAIAMLTHKNYEQLCRENILQPLGMQLIGFTVPANLASRYAQGYSAEGKPMPKMDAGLLPTASALKASAQDMRRFLKAAIGLADTPAVIHNAMQITQTPYVALPDSQQGLAWEIHLLNPQTKKALLNAPEQNVFGPLPAQRLTTEQRIFNGDNLMDKTGATNGFRAYIAVIPNQKAGIVILTNRYIPNGAIVNAGRKILLNLK